MGSYSFSGSGRAILSSPAITAPPFTMAGWARPLTVSAIKTMCYLGVPTDSQNDAHRLSNDASGKLVAATRNAAGTTAGTATSVAAMTAGTWYHCGGVWASTSSRKCYLDGVEATNGTSVTTSTSTRIVLGAAATSAAYGNNWDGALESWAFWNTDLTAEEMTALAAGVLPTEVRPLALKYWWRNIGRAGATDMQDVMGNGDLAITNGSVDADMPVVRPRRWISRDLYAPQPVSASRPRLVLVGF